ncbi:hypothetical protein VTL71DRAFT_10150 [Oculimacula yallundae]|uniref:Zn(2)-C6 fungal-type domain-containing protein n=1 Tax=Oculimacula yallundae TaxID=86028 RepID=A0ABR4BR82_9HELO
MVQASPVSKEGGEQSGYPPGPEILDAHQLRTGSQAGILSPTRACISCARAKAKCVPRNTDSSSCERCSRLRRPCEPAVPRAPSQPRKRKVLEVDNLGKHRVKKLEEKLDGIVTLLKATKDPATPQCTSSSSNIRHASHGASQEQSQLPQLPDSGSYVPESAEIWNERLFYGGTIRQRFALIGSYNPSIDPPANLTQPTFDLIGTDLGVDDPEKLLYIFRNEMNPNFPFISIPDSTSIDIMRKDQPSLLIAILAVTSRASSNQLMLGKLLMQQFADRIVVKGERNMDLLLAILTYAGWCYHHFFNVPQLTSLISLANSLVGDLRLMKPPPKDSRGFFDAVIRESVKGREDCIGTLQPSNYPIRTIEERRAALGYWYLTSLVGSFFQRGETAKWSPYLQECCSVLSDRPHHRDDKYAVALIKMQLIFERIYQDPWHGTSEQHSYTAPPILYLKTLGSDVEVLRAEISAEMRDNPFSLLHYHNIGISLNKIGLARSDNLAAFTKKDFNRLECLFACARSVRDFTDVLLGIPASMYHCMPISTYMDLTSVLGVLQMLSTFEHPDWNLDWLRETISLPDLLGRLSVRLFEVKAALNLDPGTTDRLDMFSQSAKKMGWIKLFVEKTIPGFTAAQAKEARSSHSPSVEVYDFNGDEFMGYMDDAWMKDILGPWEY